MPLRLRGCPKCAGALAPGEEPGEWACLNCGHVLYARDPLPLTQLRSNRPSHRYYGGRGPTLPKAG